MEEKNQELDNGSASTETKVPTPSESTNPPVEGNDPLKEEVMYETPDGRKVNAEQLQTEWKDNFLPEFTRKSQALADLERNTHINNRPDNEPEWKNPEFVPNSYAEVIELAKAEAVAAIKLDATVEEERVASIQADVEKELQTLKTANPSMDENDLFQHANKYGFSSLTTAFQNMNDMRSTAETIEQQTLKNVNSRNAENISTGSGGKQTVDKGYDPNEMSQYDGALSYLEHIKGQN